MKIANRRKKLLRRQVEYDNMLKNADALEAMVLEKSHHRPGSLKK